MKSAAANTLRATLHFYSAIGAPALPYQVNLIASELGIDLLKSTALDNAWECGISAEHMDTLAADDGFIHCQRGWART